MYEDGFPSEIDLGIYDVSGRLVFADKVGAEESPGGFSIDLPTALPAGVYRARANAGEVVLVGSIIVTPR